MTSTELAQDATELESAWGIRVAVEMLREQVVSPQDFLKLCQEAAEAISRVEVRSIVAA
jgi:hypothetical protein